MLVKMYGNTFQVFVDQIFRIFDKDGNGSIDFKVVTICILVKIILVLGIYGNHHVDNDDSDYYPGSWGW